MLVLYAHESPILSIKNFIFDTLLTFKMFLKVSDVPSSCCSSFTCAGIQFCQLFLLSQFNYDPFKMSKSEILQSSNDIFSMPLIRHLITIATYLQKTITPRLIIN